MTCRWASLGWCLMAMAMCSCGSTPPCERPPVASMTPARARALDPAMEAGLAVTTALDLGPCSLASGESLCFDQRPTCGPWRRPMDVYVLEVGQSLPVNGACSSGWSAADIAPLARWRGRSSPLGEWVVALEPGAYHVAFAQTGDACLRCGALEGGECVAVIEPGRVTVRDLVF